MRPPPRPLTPTPAPAPTPPPPPPRWVDGELLLFSSGSNPLITGGAGVGFVWSVPNDRRFLILLNRIQLD